MKSDAAESRGSDCPLELFTVHEFYSPFEHNSIIHKMLQFIVEYITNVTRICEFNVKALCIALFPYF